MSEGRWKYRTATVTDAAGNSQAVREMTVSERQRFVEFSQKRQKGEMTAADVMGGVLEGCTFEPKLTADDIRQMPPDLFAACLKKVMELSGLQDDDEKKGDPAPAS